MATNPFYNWISQPPWSGRRRALRARQRALLSLLATATERGLPIVPIVDAFAHDVRRGPLQDDLTEFAELMRQGESLTEALRKYPGVFPEEVRLAAAAGEETGALPATLRSAAETLNARQQIWNIASSGTLLYLGFVLLVAVNLTLFIMFYIIPKFKKIFQDFGVELPRKTTALIAVADWIISYFWLFPLAGAAAVVAIAVLHRVWNGGRFRDAFPFGFARSLNRSSWTPGVLRYLACSLQAGIPVVSVLQALSDAYGTTILHGRARVGRKLAQALQLTKRGDRLAEALRGSGLITSQEAQLVATAEQTGHAPWMLQNLADRQERDFAFRVEVAFEVGRWVLLLALGVVVGAIVIPLFLPLVELLNNPAMNQG